MSQDAGRLLLGAAAPARFCVRGPTFFFCSQVPGKRVRKRAWWTLMNTHKVPSNDVELKNSVLFWIKRCQKKICPLMNIPNTSSFGNHRAEAMGTLARYRMVGANRYAIFGRKELWRVVFIGFDPPNWTSICHRLSFDHLDPCGWCGIVLGHLETILLDG